MYEKLINESLTELRKSPALDDAALSRISDALKSASQMKTRGEDSSDKLLLNTIRQLVKERQFAEVLALEPLLSADLLSDDAMVKRLEVARKRVARDGGKGRQRDPGGKADRGARRGGRDRQPAKQAGKPDREARRAARIAERKKGRGQRAKQGARDTAGTNGPSREQLRELREWEESFGGKEATIGSVFVARPTIKDFTDQWGPVPDNVDHFLKSDWPGFSIATRRWLTSLEILADQRPDVQDIMGALEHIRRGHALTSWIRLCQRLRKSLVDVDPSSLDPEEKRFLALMDQFDEHVVGPDLTELNNAISDGRSILFACSHQGFHVTGRAVADEIDLPSVLIAKNATQDTSHRETKDIRFSPVGGDQLGFLKLVKTVRKEQYKIVIYPDGKQGATVPRDLWNGQVDFGTGGPTLAWHGKAVVFFLKCIFRDGRFVIGLEKGPDPKAFEDREEFDEEFMNRYMEMQKELLLSPLENLRNLRLNDDEDPDSEENA